MYRAFGNKARKARTYLKFRTVRNTSQKWTKHQANWEQSVSTKDEIHTDDVDVTTSTFPSEDANNQIIERIKIGSKKIRIGEDLAKQSMEFSQEATQVVQDMWNVEPIELRTSKIQCPFCGHAVLKVNIICTCGKYIRPNQEMIQCIQEACHILEALYFRTSSVSSRGHMHGHQLWQLHNAKARDALKGCSKKNKREYASIWDRWEDDSQKRRPK